MDKAETAVVSPVIDTVGLIETWIVQSSDWAARHGPRLNPLALDDDAAVEVSGVHARGVLRAYRLGSIDASVMRWSDGKVIYDIATPVEDEVGFNAVAAAFRAAIETCGAAAES